MENQVYDRETKNHCTGSTCPGGNIGTKNIAPAHLGWAGKYSCRLIYTVKPLSYNIQYTQKQIPCWIPIPCTNKIPHNLQPTERPKLTLGRRISIMKMLSMYALGKLNIFGHNFYPFSMYGTKVCVFHEPDHICFCSFLQTQNGVPLEAQVISAHC